MTVNKQTSGTGSGRGRVLMLFALGMLLAVIAVVAGVYLGRGAAREAAVHPAAVGEAEAGASAAGTLDPNAQSARLTGKAPLSGSSAPPKASARDPGAIVAPGGVELQRPDSGSVSQPAPHHEADGAQAPASAGDIVITPDQGASAAH